MNGTRTLRVAGVLALVVALAAPGTALAKKKTTKAKARTITVLVPHDYDAGGNGAGAFAPGTPVRLFDPVQLATGLGNNLLAQLGLPPVSPPTV